MEHHDQSQKQRCGGQPSGESGVVKQRPQKRHANARHFYAGAMRSCAELSEIAGIRLATMYRRLKLGWSVEKAISTPVRGT